MASKKVTVIQQTSTNLLCLFLVVLILFPPFNTFNMCIHIPSFSYTFSFFLSITVSPTWVRSCLRRCPGCLFRLISGEGVDWADLCQCLDDRCTDIISDKLWLKTLNEWLKCHYKISLLWINHQSVGAPSEWNRINDWSDPGKMWSLQKAYLGFLQVSNDLCIPKLYD